MEGDMMAKNIFSLGEIKEIIAPICRRYGIQRVYLFGSYARSEATEESDLDIRIEKGNLHGLFALSGFRLDLVDALKKEVDVVTELPKIKGFTANMNKDEVLLYEA